MDPITLRNAVLPLPQTSIQGQLLPQLDQGQLLQLQVLRTSPEIQLKIVGDRLNQFFGRSLSLLGSIIDLAGLFRTLPPRQPPALESLSLASRNLLDGFVSCSNRP